MAKKSRRKGKGKDVDPLSKPVNPPADPELAALREEKILPIIAKLRDAAVISRSQASSDVARIVGDEKCRKLLLREQIVHIILRETLTDPSLQSRAAGWTILRNLTLEENPDFCIHLYRLDILAMMQYASQMVSEVLSGNEKPFIKTTKTEKYCIREIYTSLAPLAESLATASDEIKEAITSRPAIIKLLCQLATSPDVEEDGAANALEALWRMSEDNQSLVELLLSDDETRIYKHLGSTQTSSVFPRAICSSAVLHSIYGQMGWHDKNPGPKGETEVTNLQILAKAIKGTNLEEALCDRGDRWQRRLTLLEVALEVLASIATTYQEVILDDSKSEGPTEPAPGRVGTKEDFDEEMADERDEWNGFSDDDEMMVDEKEHPRPGSGQVPYGDEDDMDMDDIAADMDIVTGQIDEGVDQKLSDLPTLEGLFQILPDIVRLAIGSWRGEERDVDGIESMRKNAIDAINNIAWTASTLDLEDPQYEDIAQQWRPLAKMLWKKVVSAILNSGTDDISLASMATGIAWAVSKSIGGAVPFSGQEHKCFIALFKLLSNTNLNPEEEASDDLTDPFQHPGVKCIGVVGQLARDPNRLDINKELFDFLLETSLDSTTRPAEMIEALNQIMEIYADEDNPSEKIFWEKEKVLGRLEDAHARGRKSVKTVDRRKEPELRERGDETLMNLFRFIKYKTKHRPKDS
ncbi:putative ARM-like repeat-containing protein [Zalerion maritima]|uniref:ARM-like repeat-containing protein n=1 Tax=Zalerion maritima TaxID=339359 RepID=A0AAD5RTH8_9PEZI|nr:putative ARM-like repeat-containing protein [Zalerion maritima]